MKKNNIPRRDRVLNRVDNLRIKLVQYEPKPYGKGNPYYYCSGCNRSMVEVSYAGHYKGCPVVGIENEIKYYLSILENKD
jgi:hypothetical protein